MDEILAFTEMEEPKWIFPEVASVIGYLCRLVHIERVSIEIGGLHLASMYLTGLHVVIGRGIHYGQSERTGAMW